MTELLTGFALVFEPLTFALMVFGVVLGIIIGALPGLTASMGIILLLPLVYRLPANTALVMLCGLFCGGMYGGSISAILLKTPGTPSASATVLDGYPLCEQGKAGKAMGVSTISSFIGGIISTICLILIAPQLAKVALKFQAADYFSLSIFGLSIMASSSGKNVVKGLVAGCIGLLASCVGIDTIVGVNRLTFNNMYLAGGFTLLPVLIGVFAISEVLTQVQDPGSFASTVVQEVKNIFPTWKELKGFLPSALIGSVIGVFIGIVPGTGGAIACFLAYNVAQKFAKDKALFGKGALSGVAAPESANNATTGGALIPMLCLGIPGDVVTSVMLGALILIGVRPGPLLFVENTDIVYSIFAGMIVIQFLMLGFGFLSARYSTHILKVPYPILMPIILVLCVVGSFSLNNSLYDVTVALAFGVIGYFMKRWNYPGAPLVLGVILGPLAEENLNRALLVSNNSWSVFVQRPISITFLILSIISIGYAVFSTEEKVRQKMMIHTGGNGDWHVIDDLLKDIAIPRMVRVRQNFVHPAALDVEQEIERQLSSTGLLRPLKKGETVAITVGSRGISNQVLAVRTIVRAIKAHGGVPFIVPAMGSHAGATAEGQAAMLVGMGFSEENTGAPIRATMETVEIGRTDEENLPVLTDRFAYEADHLVVLNRIKPHVCFNAPYESGLAKMITIGLGKQKGADIAHNLGFGHMPDHIRLIASKALDKLKVLFAVGLVENAFQETCVVEVMPGCEIMLREPQLLQLAKEYCPKLHFTNLDTLVIDEIGKNISGSGFDTKVVGRYHSDWVTGGPRINRVLILDLSKESKGNGNGLGMADFTTRRAAEKFDFTQTYPNTLTALLTGGVKIPMVLPNDLQGIQACIKTSNLADWSSARIVRIHNTLCLTEIEVSENMLHSIIDDPRFEILSEPYALSFDASGNLF